MSDYGHELRDCLREILGTVPLPPEDDALLFFKQWLAERNLGLVPIDNAASFEWPHSNGRSNVSAGRRVSAAH